MTSKSKVWSRVPRTSLVSHKATKTVYPSMEPRGQGTVSRFHNHKREKCLLTVLISHLFYECLHLCVCVCACICTHLIHVYFCVVMDKCACLEGRGYCYVYSSVIFLLIFGGGCFSCSGEPSCHILRAIEWSCGKIHAVIFREFLPMASSRPSW